MKLDGESPFQLATYEYVSRYYYNLAYAGDGRLSWLYQTGNGDGSGSGRCESLDLKDDDLWCID